MITMMIIAARRRWEGLCCWWWHFHHCWNYSSKSLLPFYRKVTASQVSCGPGLLMLMIMFTN